MALHEHLHHPECGDFLILAIALARSFRHILVDRTVFKHLTKVYCTYICFQN